MSTTPNEPLLVTNLVCSNRPRPILQKTGKNDGAWWSREVHHASFCLEKTVCGIICTDWLLSVEGLAIDDAVKDANLCKRCARKVIQIKSQ